MRLAVPLLALALALAWPLAAPAQDQPGAPVRLIAPLPAPAPPPATAPKPAQAPTGFQATPLGPLDPSWSGALAQGEPTFPPDLWQGTARVTLRALLPLLGATESPGFRALAWRLLLSGAVAPAGDDPSAGPSLLLLRAERSVALGALAGARTMLDAVPVDRRTEAAERLRIELAFAGNDTTDGCARVAAGLADHHNAWWDRANIACQLLSGARDKAALALDILHDSGAPPDPVFDAAVAAANGHAATLGPGAVLSPLGATLWAAGKQPLPAAAIAGADAATLAAFAGATDEPPVNRLGAAERAAALGAWLPDRLAELYLKSAGALPPAANNPPDAGWGGTAAGRAALFAAAQRQGDAAPRIAALDGFLDAAQRHGFYFVAARLAAPIIRAIGPGDAVKGVAPHLIRALVAAGRPQDIAPFVALADPAAIGPLVAIVHAIEGARPDDKAMAEALAALALRGSDATPRQIGLFLTLATEFRGPVPAPELATQMASGHDAPMPSAAVWLDLQQAEAAHRLGETVLAGLVVAGQDGPVTTEPIRLARALAAWRAAGLVGDARRVALDAAIAGGL